MINNVTFKIIGRSHGKAGDVSVNAQVFVNKERVLIPLSVYVDEKSFDAGAGRIKNSHAQCMHYNAIISNAHDRAAQILAEANRMNIRLERDSFRERFTHTLSDTDFVTFWRTELEAKKGSIERGTYKAQKSSLKKFVEFRSRLPFDMLGDGLIDEYERFLRKKGNNQNTIGCAMKNFKAYINAAIRNGLDIKNPFRHYKIRATTGRLVFLTIPELQSLLKAYDEKKLSDHLHLTLLVFLCQAFTSIRISDAMKINRSWLKFNQLDFKPHKTKRYNKHVQFGLSKVAERLLEDLFKAKAIKPLKSEQKINDDLKLIAAKCEIDKNLTTHVARHTFATTFLAVGGDIVVLKEIMGHGRIETTMKYVHIIDTRKTEQMGNFDNEFK